MSNLLTPQNVLVMAPGAGSKAAVIAGVLNQYTDQYNIKTAKQLAFFIGQVATESEDFTAVREDLFYRDPARLMAVWPSRFPTLDSAKPYAQNPNKLANMVYANRMGNGNAESNDGFMFRGVGWIQLTGRDNITQFAKANGLTTEQAATYMATTAGAAHSACWYWDSRKINQYVESGNIDAVSDAVNLGRQTKKYGDSVGFAKRVAKTQLALKTLGA